MTTPASPSVEGLTLRRRDAVAELILDRPTKRNALTLEMWAALPGLLAEVQADPAVAVLVVRGKGSHFSAGADVAEFETRRIEPADVDLHVETVENAERALTGLCKPSIAMINGYCLGGGCELAMACDLRIAASDAVLGITASRLGIVYPFLSTHRLVAAVGASYAKYVLMTGAHIEADEALRARMVDRLVPVDELEVRAFDLAEMIASRSQVSVRGALTIIDKIAAGARDADEEAAALPAESARSADYREGVRAFLEKRPARFVDGQNCRTVDAAGEASQNTKER